MQTLRGSAGTLAQLSSSKYPAPLHIFAGLLRGLELCPDLIAQPLTITERFLGFQLVDDARGGVDRGVVENGWIDVRFSCRDDLGIVGDADLLSGDMRVHQIVQEGMGRDRIGGRL